MAGTGQGTYTYQGFLKPLGVAQITSLSASAGFASVPAGTKMVLLQSETQNVRWRDDGTAPTASVGMIIFTAATQPFAYYGDMSAIKFIEVTTSAKLNVAFFG